MTTAFPLIEVGGPPRQRGIEYGRQAGERIEAGLRLYKEEFARRATSWPQALEFARGVVPAIEHYSVDLMAEIGGIAQGSEQPVEAIVALNARTEIIHAGSVSAAENTPIYEDLELTDECTSALASPAMTSHKTLIHGQNWDWRPECAGTAVVLKIHAEEGPDILTFTEAGQLARHGMNSAGVTITANGLHCDQDVGKQGVPVPVVRRHMLKARNLAVAFGILLASERSGSHSITIGHRGGEAIGVEAVPQEAFWLRPESGLLTHANHFKSPAAMAKLKDLGLMLCPESLYRDSRVEVLLREQAGTITVESFKRAFADEYGAPDAVCRHPSARRSGFQSATVATIIMENDRMWVAPLPYQGQHFTEYRL